MMETDPPRPVPSRYKTVRRKPALPVVATPVPAMQGPPQPPLVQPPPTTPLIDLQSKLLEDANADPPQLQRQQSRFRKLLRLNTKDHPPAPLALPHTAPPSVPSSRRHTESHRRQVMSPEGSRVQSDQSDDDLEKQRAREDAIAALEGKRRPSKHRKPVEDTFQGSEFEVKLYHDKHSPVTVPMRTGMDAGALLHKVRPGHDRCLIECWPTLGVQRPVRYFELVVDVMNTWDVGASSQLSHLRLGKNVWGESNTRLENYPKAEPTIGETMFYYYVTGDKKWSRRTISIGGGILNLMKKEKPSYDKDHLQTINLDSFDIYSFIDTFAPSSKLRCPTKFCFALKSQHKQSLFGKNAVFAHYFAIDDQTLFTRWFGVIQEAKARMIAEKRGIAPWVKPTKEEKVRTPLDERHNPFADGSPASDRGRPFPKPLISPEELSRPPSSGVDRQRSKSLHRGRSVRTARHDRSPAPNGLVGNLHEELFSPGGLLGADYEEKKRLALLQYKEERAKEGLINTHSRPSSSGSASNGLQRNRTVTSRPPTADKNGGTGTLLSFGAGEINAKLPHHAPIPRGRAHTINEQKEGGLISYATTHRRDETPPPMPPLRRPTTAKKMGYSSEDEGPFTGTGLLARGYTSAGSGYTGHGVHRNGETGPLVDVGPKSVFAPGSLLERREREMGGPQRPQRPVIDRDPHSSDSDDY